MNVRISTGMMYSQSLASIQSKQASLARIQQQLSTGQRLVTAKDDPVAAGTAVGLDRALAELERFGSNAANVQNRLGLQENVLAQAGEMMGRVTELTVQANSGALSDADRAAIAKEIGSIRDGLLDLANSTDGSGRFLFAGADDASAPFSISGGAAVYGGDQTQRRVEIAPQMFVADSQPGSEVFMRVRTGDGRVDASPGAANAGTGLLRQFALSDSAAWNGGTHTVAFTAADAYEVRDGGGAVIASGAYVPGESIAFAGLQMRIEGEPAPGDEFTIGPAGTRDVFATLDRLMSTLSAAPTSDQQIAAQQNALQQSMRDVASAQAHLVDARAAGGAQLSAIDTAAELRDSQALTIETTLSGMRDLDYAEAISRFTLEQTALEAAQLSFTQMQRLSLFNMIR
ncbi:flagellar hook-associated protein FlgL [Luteimonas sp. RD2P54]|uniref:Flagellar hook-associated protein FlgL n=1 Tax=Luteimonas endophytica TaxID=3042023 RepID=A0ABT6J7F5_9GAMM|nr:flagellar hook-associated protein FlgL [Luteimonas endophytica]MDH5822753.1 flagellar hook-associated protein FlgL [Luteimonas endophytica]